MSINVISMINVPLPNNVDTNASAIYQTHNEFSIARINRSNFLNVESVFEFDDRIWLFNIHKKIVLLDLEKLICHCDCADFNLTMSKQGSYCKHIYKAITWLVNEKRNSIKINSIQNTKIKLNLEDD